MRGDIKNKILGIFLCGEAKDFVFIEASCFHPKGFCPRKFYRHQPPSLLVLLFHGTNFKFIEGFVKKNR